MVLINISDVAIGDHIYILVEIMKIVAILSMIEGALGEIMEFSLKRSMGL